ncbi:MAG: 50S ribosomal protein L2, partial [Clostridia bacterium]|nr:50S ribosomal protein L2 [Clostridia bacterium]
MSIRVLKPVTNGTRNMSVTDYSALSKCGPEKSLLAPLNKKSGRNSYGRITVRHHGGGNKKKYRIIDFRRMREDAPAKVIGIEYDPNRTAYIALLQYENGDKSYIVAPAGLKDGDTVYTGAGADMKV